MESLKKLGLKPIDDRRHSYAFESRRVYSPVGHNLARLSSLQKEHSLASDNDHECEVKSICSSADSLDGGSLGSDAGHTCNEKTPKIKRNPAKAPLRRNASGGNIADKPSVGNGDVVTRPRTATPSSGKRPARRSLVERQGDYSEKGKLASFQRKLVTSSNFA